MTRRAELRELYNQRHINTAAKSVVRVPRGNLGQDEYGNFVNIRTGRVTQRQGMHNTESTSASPVFHSTKPGTPPTTAETIQNGTTAPVEVNTSNKAAVSIFKKHLGEALSKVLLSILKTGKRNGELGDLKAGEGASLEALGLVLQRKGSDGSGGSYVLSPKGQAFVAAAMRGNEEVASKVFNKTPKKKRATKEAFDISSFINTFAAAVKENIPQEPAQQPQTGIMVALYLPPEQQRVVALDIPEAVRPEELHCTLCYLGDTRTVNFTEEQLIDAVRKYIAEGIVTDGTIDGNLNGIGLFNGNADQEQSTFFVTADSADLCEFHYGLEGALNEAGIPIDRSHGYFPHVSVAFVPPGKPIPALQIQTTPVSWNTVTVGWGDHYTHLPLQANAQKEQAYFAVYKSNDDTWRWVSISSSAFMDRDKEIIPKAALTADVERADATKEYGPLLWWHMPELKIGQCDFNMMMNNFLVESGTFDDPRIAEAISDNADKLGTSLGYHYPLQRRGPGTVFKSITRFERSFLLEQFASNWATKVLVKENAMTDEQKREEFKALFKNPAMGEQVLAALTVQTDAATKQAQLLGIAYKASVDVGAASPAVNPPAAMEEDKKEQPVAEKADAPDPSEQDAPQDTSDENLLLDMTRDDLQALISQTVQAALTPMMQAMQSLLSAGSATKEASDTAAVQVASLGEALKNLQAAQAQATQRLAQVEGQAAVLLGNMPSGAASINGFRASTDASTVVGAGSALKQQGEDQIDPDFAAISRLAQRLQTGVGAPRM